MRVVVEVVFSNADMSTSLTSKYVDTTSMFMAGLYASWTGVPVGLLSFQGSYDNKTWFDVGTPSATGGVAGSTVMEFPNFMWPYCRIRYTRTSGVGNITAIINCKGA